MNLFPLLQMGCAPAQTAGGAPQASPWQPIILIVLLVVVFYFFMIRPQRKRQKETENKRASLKNGDRVITAGGIHGTIREVKDKDFIIEIADGVRIRVDKSSVYNTIEEDAKDKK